MSLRRRLERAWWEGGEGDPLPLALTPLALLYGGIAAARRIEEHPGNCEIEFRIEREDNYGQRCR